MYGGGVRRAADTAEDLARIETIPLTLTAAVDPSSPSTLVVRAPSLPPGQPGVLAVELGVRLPPSLRLEVEIAGSGHVTVAERTGPTQVATGRGDLRFEHCAGPLKARTGRGNVIVIDHRSDLDVHTMVGDMQAFVKEPGAQLRLVTGQGTVQCYVPHEAGFVVEARAAIGHIKNAFGLPVETVQRYGAAMVGRHGDGRTQLVLNTGSGHLSLQAKRFE
jgi:hypothetical protein